jgi:hypothetical protein
MDLELNGRLMLAFIVTLLLLSILVGTYLLILRLGRRSPPFVLPIGVVPLTDELRKQVKLSTGYVFFDVSHPRYRRAYHVSLSTERIEQFVNAFVERVLANRGYAILEWAEIRGDGKETYHTYGTCVAELSQVIARMRPYMFRLTNDGNVSFGYASSNSSEEIVVTEKKVIHISTSQFEVVEDLLRKASIPRMKKPRFITEYATARGDVGTFSAENSILRSKEFFSIGYVPELLEVVGFHENLVARTDNRGVLQLPSSWVENEQRGLLH